MVEPRKLKVFLCHATQNKPLVRELYQKLSIEDWIDPWLDEEKLLPGMNWDIEIEKAVENADAVILCLSQTSVTKEGYIQRELKYVLDIALEKPEDTIFIIPLRLDDVQPPRRLRTWQYTDYFPLEQRESSYAKLRQALKLRHQQLHGTKQQDVKRDIATKGSRTGKEDIKTDSRLVCRLSTDLMIKRLKIHTRKTPKYRHFFSPFQ